MLSASDTHLAGLGFGANLGDPAQQISDALRTIATKGIGRVTKTSSLWRTPPWGDTDQPPFLNACALMETSLAPHALLAALQDIERTIGRVPSRRWGPRAIDIDILFYDDLVLSGAELTLPHATLFERAFVLAPLAEIAGERIVAGRRVDAALAQVDRTGLDKLFAPQRARHFEGVPRMGETISLTCSDGKTISAYRAQPAGTPKGGMVVLQEIFGVNAHIRSVADRYAQAGYLAVAPALFDRVEPGIELGYDGGDMERARDIRGRTILDDTLKDIAAAVSVAAQRGPVGVVGYCWGGSLAFAAAVRLDGIKAAVGYYGGMIVSMLDAAPRVPAMLHFGAKDRHIPLTDVEKIRDAFPAVPVFVYDADHGFNCDTRASFDEAAAATARERTMAFFADHLH